MQPSPEGQLHEARRFLELCTEFGNIMDSIYEGLKLYQTERESADLEQFEWLNEVFVKAIPAMREQLDEFQRQHARTVEALGGEIVQD